MENIELRIIRNRSMHIGVLLYFSQNALFRLHACGVRLPTLHFKTTTD
jgi:hypothetical protein